MKRACVFAAAAVMFTACVCAAQPPAAGRPPATASQPPPRAGGAGDADEDFELNIVERRITEANFFASTAVGGAAGGLDLRVGVALGAGRIDVLLRNVRGRVRFRGSLGALGRVLDAHRAPPGAAAPPGSVP